MIGACLAFVTGSLVVTRLPALPDMDALFMLLPVGLAGLMFRFTKAPAAFVLGLLLTYGAVQEQLALRIPADGGGERRITGEIIGLPVESNGIAQFMFRVSSGDLAGSRLRLTWYKPSAILKPGQHWQWHVRIGPPTGSVNFRQFDYEQWLFVKRIHGRGYVRSTPEPLLLATHIRFVDGIRFDLQSRLRRLVGEGELGTFLALSLGDTSQLDPSRWTLLNATGTTHLVIVSGLHTGLVAALTYAILRYLGIAYRGVIAGTLCVTLAYALIAGWGLPIQRALVMTGVVLLSLLMRRQLPFNRQFFVALIAVVILDPLAGLSNGFWLSFGAVVVLLFGLGGQVGAPTGLRGWVLTSIRAQWVIFLALSPLLALLMDQIPVSSFLVNLIAIPWVGLLLVPSLFVSLLMVVIYEPLGIVLVKLSELLVRGLWVFLEAAGSITAIPMPGIPVLLSCAGLMGGLLLISPRGLVPRWTGLLLLLLLMTPPRRVDEGAMRATFLDVGQGLSVLIETASTVHLYDTGPKFGTRFSAAEQVVLPALRQSGWQALSSLIISHGDNDHAGGAEDIRRALSIEHEFGQNHCAGYREVDGVKFHVFSSGSGGRTGNNNSCLLHVSTAEHDLLLTGDIEEAGELSVAAMSLPLASVMSSPHHGSNTSSSPALLNALIPGVVVVSAGFNNRFGHPDDRVVGRYRQRFIKMLNTADEGAVRFDFTGPALVVRSARREQPAIWRRHIAAKP